MKQTLSIAILLLFAINVQAGIFIAAEGGIGEVGMKSTTKDQLTPFWGLRVGVKYKMLIAGAGMRSWGTKYLGPMQLTDRQGYEHTFGSTFNIRSTSLPVFAGIDIPLDDKLSLQAIGMYAPTFVRKNVITLLTANMGAIVAKETYSAAGIDIAAEYKASKHIAVTFKFTHFAYLDGLKYTVTDAGAARYFNNVKDKPTLNAVALQFNYYF